MRLFLWCNGIHAELNGTPSEVAEAAKLVMASKAPPSLAMSTSELSQSELTEMGFATDEARVLPDRVPFINTSEDDAT